MQVRIEYSCILLLGIVHTELCAITLGFFTVANSGISDTQHYASQAYLGLLE